MDQDNEDIGDLMEIDGEIEEVADNEDFVQQEHDVEATEIGAEGGDEDNVMESDDVEGADSGKPNPEDSPDISDISFTLHTDAVYCIAFHPFISNLIATGKVCVVCFNFCVRYSGN